MNVWGVDKWDKGLKPGVISQPLFYKAIRSGAYGLPFGLILTNRLNYVTIDGFSKPSSAFRISVKKISLAVLLVYSTAIVFPGSPVDIVLRHIAIDFVSPVHFLYGHIDRFSN